MGKQNRDPLHICRLECRAMVNHLHSRGLNISSDLVKELTTIESNLIKMDKEEGDIAAHTDLPELAARLTDVHNTLAELILPAKPSSILVMEEEMSKNSPFLFLGRVPMVRRMMFASLVSMITLMAIGLSDKIDTANMMGNIFTLSDSDLLFVFIFLLAAAGVGASFSALFRANKYIVAGTFDSKYETSYWIRFVVGLMSGIIITQLVPTGDLDASTTPADIANDSGTLATAKMTLQNMVSGVMDTSKTHVDSLKNITYYALQSHVDTTYIDSVASQLSRASVAAVAGSGFAGVGKVTLALLGGFSSDLVYKILNHLVTVVEHTLIPSGDSPEADALPKFSSSSSYLTQQKPDSVKPSVTPPEEPKQPAESKANTTEPTPPPPSQPKVASSEEPPKSVAVSKDEPEPAAENEKVLHHFRGDMQWVHQREGHLGKPYWPGGISGVTFDPGMDLGHASEELVHQLYSPLLTDEQLTAAKTTFGIKGEKAKEALRNNTVLRTVRISREEANGLFKYAAKPYWEAITKRFPTLIDNDTLGSVQTALLSISYNRGARNRGLKVLEEPLHNKNWSQAADVISAMQQDHKIEGIRKRRRMEGALIRDELSRTIG